MLRSLTLVFIGLAGLVGSAAASDVTPAPTHDSAHPDGVVLGIGFGAMCSTSGTNCTHGTWSLAGSVRFVTTRHFALEPEISYGKWSGPYVGFGSFGEAVTHTVEDILVGGNALFVFPGRTVALCFGPGAGVHFLREDDAGTVHYSDGSAFTFVANGSHHAHFGVQLVAGLDVNITRRLQAFVTGRLDWVYYGGESGDVIPQYREQKAYAGLRLRFD